MPTGEGGGLVLISSGAQKALLELSSRDGGRTGGPTLDHQPRASPPCPLLSKSCGWRSRLAGGGLQAAWRAGPPVSYPGLNCVNSMERLPSFLGLKVPSQTGGYLLILLCLLTLSHGF